MLRLRDLNRCRYFTWWNNLKLRSIRLLTLPHERSKRSCSSISRRQLAREPLLTFFVLFCLFASFPSHTHKHTKNSRRCLSEQELSPKRSGKVAAKKSESLVWASFLREAVSNPRAPEQRKGAPHSCDKTGATLKSQHSGSRSGHAPPARAALWQAFHPIKAGR